MALILLGAFLMVVGLALAAIRSASRGRLSRPPSPAEGESRGTLEPSGRGKRLSLKTDLPGVGLMILGGILIFAGAASYG